MQREEQWPSPESGRLDRLRSTVELVGTVAVTTTQIAAALGIVASVVRRRSTSCR